VAHLAAATGHSVAAIGSAWALPEQAHLIFGTPQAVLDSRASDRVSLDHIGVLVIDQAQLLEALGTLGVVEHVLDHVPPEAQRVLSALPVTDAITDFAARHVRRAVTLPTDAESTGPRRGTVRFRIVSEAREAAAVDVVEELLAGDARNVLVFCRSEDRAADLGDYMTLRGFVAGAPGDTSVPVWLGVDALEARAAASGIDGVVVLSCDVPSDRDSLDRRHSISQDGVVVVLPREVPHMRDLARRTGYVLAPFPVKLGASEAITDLCAPIERALDEEDIAPYLIVLEPLFQRHDPTEVAAATLALLRKKHPPAPVAAPRAPGDAVAEASAPSWAKLFLGVGARDGLRPGDVLGAITGEAGVSGDAVGRIDIKESHSLVEVHDTVARKVIDAINGTTIKGRAVRADFDRPRRGPTRARNRSR
jgi:ATP-dependent RNA helicase DeaD